MAETPTKTQDAPRTNPSDAASADKQDKPIIVSRKVFSDFAMI